MTDPNNIPAQAILAALLGLAVLMLAASWLGGFISAAVADFRKWRNKHGN